MIFGFLVFILFSQSFEESVTKIKLPLSTFFVELGKNFLLASCPTFDPCRSPEERGWPVTPSGPVQLEQRSAPVTAFKP